MAPNLKLSLTTLFPQATPGLAPSVLSPTRFQGVSPESSTALQSVLKDNHVKWRIFFNEQRFHNHAAHIAIAVWALGANGSVIQAGYNKDINYEKPAFKSPEEITVQNFNKHLGDDKYFNAYMNFFTDYVQEKGFSAALEDYVFSPKANLGTNEAQLPDDKAPHMLSRLLTGVLYPLIHIGYGAEFNLPGMIVEGLALTAVHQVPPDLLGPLALFEHIQSKASSTIDEVKHTADEDIHALSILARIMRDHQFNSASTRNSNEGPINVYNSMIEKYNYEIAKHVRAWTINVSKISGGDSGEFNRKIEEVTWVICVLYGIGGWTGREPDGGSGCRFKADFFLMHLVTSSVFLPSLCAFLSPSSKVRLLRAYFASVCTWYVARGRPALDIAGFFSQEINIPSGHGLDSDAMKGGVQNLWNPLLQSAIAHPDGHLIETLRALSSWAQKFGVRKDRVLPIKDDDLDSHALSNLGLDDSDTNALIDFDTMPITELPGSEYLDGTLFLRTGLLTADRVGWVRESESHMGEFWDFKGFSDQKNERDE